MAMLQVQAVNKSFRGLRALCDVNLDVEEGSVHAIIGPNGAGKSTLLNCFVGRLTPRYRRGAVPGPLADRAFAARDQSGRRGARVPDTGYSRT